MNTPSTSSLTVEDLIRCAKRFGTDQVPETAVQAGFSVEEIARVIKACDEADIERFKKKNGFSPRKKRNRLTYEERAKRLLGIEDEKEEPTSER